MKSLILHQHEAKALAAGNLSLIVRPVKPLPPDYGRVELEEQSCRLFVRASDGLEHHCGYQVWCPLGSPGTQLWCRETFRIWKNDEEVLTGQLKNFDSARLAKNVEYRVGCVDTDGPWRSSVTMPQWASRFTIETVSVEVKRVHTIGADGYHGRNVLAAGIPQAAINKWKEWLHPDDAPAHTFGEYWDVFHGKDAWDRNDWCWFVKVRKV